jgi:hypothetical protein
MKNRIILLCLGMSFKAVSQLSPNTATASCNNEDFEAGPVGQLTSSSSVNGWSAFRMNQQNNSYGYPGIINNCNSLTSTAVTTSSPSSVEIISTGTTGHIDPNIGASYPIFSIFGSGAVNGGTLYNPGLSTFGDKVIRVNSTNNSVYDYRYLEKDIVVLANNSLFRVAYISVLQQGTSCCDAPAMKMIFQNASAGNTLLACPNYSAAVQTSFCPGNTASPNYSPITLSTNSTIVLYYHPWKVEAVDLSAYIGSTIRFKAAFFSCTCGGKLGYGYLDAQCGPMEIYVNNIPFPANSSSVTFLGCGVPSATVVAPPDFAGYQWTGPGGFTSTLSTITTSVSGVYTLNISNSGGCSTAIKYVNVGLYPAPSVSISTTNTMLCKGIQSATITASGALTYSWNVQPNTASIVVTKPQSNATYTVTGLDVNGCTVTSVFTQSVVSCLDVKTYQSFEDVAVFPNPASDELSVSFAGESGYFSVLDNTGKIILTQALTAGTNKINTSRIAQGFYYYLLHDAGQPCQRGKLLIDRN